MEPWAVAIGLGIALIELAIGIGALTAFGFRLAAFGGFGLSLLFWLTASWTIRPFYLGPDLPFAAGWLTLLLAGHGDVLVPRWADRDGRSIVGRTDPSMRRVARRAVLQAAILGAAAVVAASLTVPFRVAEVETTETPDASDGTDAEASGPGGSPTPSAHPPTASPSPTPSPLKGLAVATLASLGSHAAAAFTVPFDAPAPLPAGDPAVLVKLAGGSYVAFDALCTHAGCTVEYDAGSRLLVCPCHGATFDPGALGAALQGPTDQPLVELPLVLDEASGTFLLRMG